MVQKIIELFFGTKHKRDMKVLLPLLHKINSLESWAMDLSEDDFKVKSAEYRGRIESGDASLDDILPEAYAMAREAGRRVLGERLYDVQLLGSITLHKGQIVEMKTGEGKTLSSVPAIFLNALSGKGVHVVTVNDYLAERDANWMKPVYEYLGVTVGVILGQMDTDNKKLAYAKDITYGTNNEFGFDYLRDNMAFDAKQKVQRPHSYCVIDEIDSILIDESRTPLIISGSMQEDTKKYSLVSQIVPFLTEVEKDPETGDYPEEGPMNPDVKLVGDYKLDEKSKKVSFTDDGINKIEKLLIQRNIIAESLFISENFEFLHHVTQAVRAHKLYTIDKDYVVKDGKVEIVDEFTGRIMHGRRYSEGLHQAIEAKEGIKVAQRNRTLATITFQNYFRMYDKISGMTGTADTEAKEFAKIYDLDVVVIPTNRPVSRNDLDDLIYLDDKFKSAAIAETVKSVHATGQPILVGTASIEKSEEVSKILRGKGIPHEVLNAKNHSREASIIAEAGAKGSVTIATNMAGRGTDIKLGGNPEHRAKKRAGTDASPEEYQKIYNEEYAKWRENYNEIKELGGLYILGTERHESRRIDNQLRGRAGRQGDPGVSQFYISMDDDLMRLFGKGNLKGMLGALGMDDGEPINHKMISNSLEKAQTRVEDRNFEIRKHLLEYDDVLNEQRNFIYSARNEILNDANILERIHSTTDDLLDDIFAEYAKNNSDAVLAEITTSLKNNFLYDLSVEEVEAYPGDKLQTAVAENIKKDLNEKAEKVGTEYFNMVLRFEYLKAIDKKWQEHLENLENLRDAVYLRSYAQKNPLLEYKLEGFKIFDQLIWDIRTGVAKKFHMLRVEGIKPGQQPGRQGKAVHSSINPLAMQRQQAPRGGAKPVQVVRSVPKVGRNEPCPCGSGKKYKACHGK